MLLAISVFADIRDVSPVRAEMSLPDDITTPATFTGDKRSLPLWSPALYDDGEARAESNVATLSALVYDCDQDIDTRSIEQAPFMCFAHTTPSSVVGALRWRVIVPLPSHLRPHEWRVQWAQCRQQLGLTVDDKARDAARMFFVPAQKAEGYYTHVQSNSSGLFRPILDVAQLVLEAEARLGPAKLDVVNALTCAAIIPQGQRDDTVNRIMFALSTLPSAPTPEQARPLAQLVARSVDLGGDTEESWVDVAMQKYTRGYTKTTGEKIESEKFRAALTDVVTSTTPEDDWKSRLLVKTDKNGDLVAVKTNGFNLGVILEHHPDFAGHIRLNVLRKRIEITGGPLQDSHWAHYDTAISNWLESGTFKMTLPRSEIAAQLAKVAQNHEYNPVQRWLESLKWDGISRAERLFTSYCDARNPDQYLTMASKKFLLGAVGRAMNPGCQVDECLVLLGPQGAGKTNFVRSLGGEWATSCSLDLASKDAVMVATGAWMVELSELASTKRSAQEQVKAFLTVTIDSIRLPYTKSVESFPRTCVFVGTTNEQFPFKDRTGSRRFVPVYVHTVDFAALKRDREQIFAEAMHLYRAGERHVISGEECEAFEEERGAFSEEDSDISIADTIRLWYTKREHKPLWVSASDIAVHAFGCNHESMTKMLNPISRALVALGAHRKRRIVEGIRKIQYRMPASLGAPKKLLKGEPGYDAENDD